MNHTIFRLLLVTTAFVLIGTRAEAYFGQGVASNRRVIAQDLPDRHEQTPVTRGEREPLVGSRDRLIAEVNRLGGKLEFDEALKGKPIIKIDLHSTAVTDADLEFLDSAKKHLKDLRFLDLRLTKISDAGVANLRNLKGLQTLNLFRTQLSDRGLSDLKNLKHLQTLLIGGTRVTDAGMVHLARFKELKKLSLFQTQVSDAGIPNLKRLARLETLLIGGSRISQEGAKELQQALPRVSFKEMT